MNYYDKAIPAWTKASKKKEPLPEHKYYVGMDIMSLKGFADYGEAEAYAKKNARYSSYFIFERTTKVSPLDPVVEVTKLN